MRSVALLLCTLYEVMLVIAVGERSFRVSSIIL